MSNPSQFGGWYKAANFAYGAPGGPGALVVDESTPTVATSPVTDQSVVTAFGFTTTSDGIIFWPLADNAPIQLGNSDDGEVVTPTSVSGFGQTGYHAVSFVAPVENDHGSGDQISSATFGLQEAANYAGLQGGGIVIVDAEWTRLGGTTSMYNAVDLPSGVTKLDHRP